MNYNLRYFSSNYNVVFLILSIYSLWSNRILILLIVFVVGGMWAIGKLDGCDLDIGGTRATASQLYSGMVIIAVPLFSFIVPPFAIILRIIGVSGVSIFAHASFMDKPIETAFFRGGGLGGRPRTPYVLSRVRPPWVKGSKQRKRYEWEIPVPFEESDSDDSLSPTRGSALELVDQLKPVRSTELADRSHPPVGRSLKGESQPSIYERLDPGQIRLVDLLSGDGTEPVAVQLLAMPFDENVKFEALSYSVGKPQKTAILSLRHLGRREQLPVTARLESILRSLRYPDRNRRLWVDAISINQEDLEERAREVRRIGEIFAKAQNVCIWLGSSADDSDLAVDFISEVLDFGAFDRLVRDDSKKRHWLALAKLMAREWFTRRWVVQEMALAQKATVHCGSRAISWPDMAAAAALFGTHWEEIVRRQPPLEAFMFGDIQTPGATSLVELSTKVLRRDQSRKGLQRRLGLEALLATLPMFDVTVPSDAIYSIIDIAHDTYDANPISVDYGLEPTVLFSEVIDFIIKKSGSMDIICRPWAPVCSNLPSYVSTLSEYAFERRQDGQYYRQNADSLTGFPGRSFYRAAANTLPQHLMTIASGQRTLECKGRPLGRVIATGGRSVNGNVPREWAELAGWIDRSHPVPEIFWRTLVADRGPGGTDPPSWYGNACNYAFARGRRDIDVSELLKISTSSNERQFLRRVQATVWNRTFFTTRDSEDTLYFGLGPSETTSGDLIAIIFGCSVAVVLRKQSDLELSSAKHVGECFIHGYMDGEAVRSPGRNADVTFRIV